MGARSAAASVVRHAGGVAAEATLVAALVAAIALVFSPVYAPAKFLAGTDKAAAKGTGDAIWIKGFESTGTSKVVAILPYGSQFAAGYSTKAAQPWGFAQCWANDTTVLGTPNQGTYTPGDVIWSEYRSLYPGGPVPADFQLTDPLQHLWLGGGADCTISLVKFSGGYSRQTVLATTPFTVMP